MTQRTQLFQHGDQEFLIRVERDPAGFVGTWYCVQLGRSGTSTRIHDTVDAALSSAISEIQAAFPIQLDS